MCGIFGLINKTSSESTFTLVRGTDEIHHRGPDDEGYLLWNLKTSPTVFAGKRTSLASRQKKELDFLPETTQWKVGLGHKRLSIVDLSPGGHQPFVHSETGISLSFNGEIYNYIELREELKIKGYTFKTETDTEVLLLSWVEWGESCLNKLNGMFAFIILDPRSGGKLYAVRDRFGIKPLYWASFENYIVFASEIKQIKTLPGFSFQLNDKITFDYLSQSLLDHSSDTFSKNIFQLRGGEMATVELASHQPFVQIKQWYDFQPDTFNGSIKEAEEKFFSLFKESIRIHLRSDVPLGSCLSGGLDSSAIVCMIYELLEKEDAHMGQETVTACFEEQRYDEWQFAETVIRQTNSKSHRVWPSMNKLQNELDKLIWHLDEPFGSTSQFSQWCVFEGAAKSGLKVMLDGQGSDEQLAGYGGNDASLYSGLLKKLKLASLYSEMKSFKKTNGFLPKAQLIEAAFNSFPFLFKSLPSGVKAKFKKKNPGWLNLDFEPNVFPVHTLRDSLYNQTFITSLPSLLRYEDRNSMAFSIESRVPFLDHRLVEFIFSLPEKHIYKNGLRKVILRNSLKNILPKEINERRDKMGFVTPEETWIKSSGKEWFKEGIMMAVDQSPEIFRKKETEKFMNDVINGVLPFDFTLWRILCLGKWLSLNRK